MNISVEITGDKQTLKKIQNILPVIDNFKQPLDKIGQYLEHYYSNQAFSSKGGVYGMPWAQLAPSTVAFKIKHYRQFASTPLIATKTMKNSFTYESTSNSLVIKNTAPYFLYHQSTEEPRTKIPRRQIMGVTSSIKNSIKHTIGQDIQTRIREMI